MKRKHFCRQGFTLVEILVTLAILSFGIVQIFRVYVISLDRMSYLTNRIYAHIELNNRIERIDRSLKMYQALPLDTHHEEELSTGVKTLKFNQRVQISEVEDFADIFQIDVELLWQEDGQPVRLSRSAYISDFGFLHAK